MGRIVMALVACMGLLLSGCAANVRALSQEELEVFQQLQKRLEANNGALDAALDDIEKVDADALVARHAVLTSLAHAQLLERMNAPWASPSDPLVATQKEVALYHLYALSEARADVLQAKLEERRASVAQVRAAYGKLLVLTKRMIVAEKLIVQHLEQPSSAWVLSFVTELASEARAFSGELEGSDNSRLQQLASKVEGVAARLEEAEDAARKAADELGKLRDGSKSGEGSP